MLKCLTGLYQPSSKPGPLATDGPFETSTPGMANKRKGGDIAAIFVHAGAGFHSLQNESIHLEACAKAAEAGMAYLKNGSSAVDAVEVAIRALEANEITNAGYGSNLAIDGTVECDATIVDHYGRSGAVGAMGQVAHPIHVARLILDGTSRRLSLRRVPPNLLTGQGAIDYAFDHDVPIMPHDYLVSRTAKERWKKWTKDLSQANERTQAFEDGHPVIDKHRQSVVREAELPRTPSSDKRLAPLINESQPYSPDLSPSRNTPVSGIRDINNQQEEDDYLSMRSPSAPPIFSNKLGRGDGPTELMLSDPDDELFGIDPSPPRRTASIHELDPNVPMCPTVDAYSTHDQSSPEPLDDLDDSSDDSSSDSSDDTDTPSYAQSMDDHITDTVGAIAIDQNGNIAAGSSSGGIGMKHKGRTGPAALVGIGTAVHPAHVRDRSKRCVAVVTSGTGEHMATTMAAGTCADRMYWNTKTSANGKTVEADDDSAIQSFVKDDFMGHPSVQHSNTSAAIGVMAVTRDVDGVWFHFAHNTDSFALCSMTSEDKEPAVVMSRLPSKTTSLTSGGRSCSWRPSKEDGKDNKRRRKSVGQVLKGYTQKAATTGSNTSSPSISTPNTEPETSGV